MKIAVAQIDSTLNQKELNVQKIKQQIITAAKNGAKFILFPEMSDTGYNMNAIKKSCSSANDSTYKIISQEAIDSNIIIGCGLSDKRSDGIYNTLTIFKTDKTIQYDKTHLFSATPVFEDRHLKSGNHLTTCEIEEFKAGAMICYDIRFPELARSYTMQKATILLVSSAWPKVRIEHWVTLLKARAIENQCFVIASNRVGTDSGLIFAGTSLIISPTGEIIAEGSANKEEIIYGEINLDKLKKVREKMLIFNDKRTDIYNL